MYSDRLCLRQCEEVDVLMYFLEPRVLSGLRSHRSGLGAAVHNSQDYDTQRLADAPIRQ